MPNYAGPRNPRVLPMSRVLCWLMLLCVGPLSAASITGAVTASDTGGAIETAEVIAFNAFDPSEHVTTFSGADGSFNLTLPAGTYALIAQHPEYSAELYEEQACCSDFSPATPVTVTQDEVRSGVNFTLARGASIAGTVRRRDDATPLANVGVRWPMASRSRPPRPTAAVPTAWRSRLVTT